MQIVYKMIFRTPYTISLYILKWVSRISFSIELWPRHSYTDHTFVPFKSDLDISVFSAKSHNLRQFSVLYAMCRRLLPFLGEVNYYSRETIVFLKKYNLNSYELNRDPRLARLLEGSDLDFSHIQALVFLHRTFVSDYENIRKNKKPRLQKWKNNFDIINEKLKKINPHYPYLNFKESELINSVSTAIINLSGLTNKDEAEMERIKFQLMLELVVN